MNLFSLLSNNALFVRFLQFVALIPVILRFVELAEATDLTGEEKRKNVLVMTNSTATALIKSGFLPPEAKEGLAAVAGELTDAIVGVYNTTGLFKHAPPEKGKDWNSRVIVQDDRKEDISKKLKK